MASTFTGVLKFSEKSFKKTNSGHLIFGAFFVEGFGTTQVIPETSWNT